LEHNACEGDEVEVCKGLGASFVVLDEPPEAGRPCKGPLDDPSSGQHEAGLGLGQQDDFESDPVFGGRRCGLLAGVTLIDESDFDAMVQHAQVANVRLPKSFPKGFTLDETHYPHISILQQFVR
jgi:hypothetical protein